MAHFLLHYPSTTLSSRLMSGYKIAQLGFQTFTLPFGLDVLQARLAGVSVDRSCWRGCCGQSSAVGPPSGRCSAPRAPCPPGSSAGSRFAGGKRCMCTHREARLCGSFASGCLCFAASTRVFWGRRARSSVPAGRGQARRNRWRSGELVPSAKRAQSFRSLGTFSRDQQRYEPGFGQLMLSRDDMGDVQSGAARICNTTGGSFQC